jgi:hypothetical protein
MTIMTTTNDKFIKMGIALLLAITILYGAISIDLSSYSPTNRAQSEFAVGIPEEQPQSEFAVVTTEEQQLLPATATAPGNEAMPAISWWYLSLLALQFGCQPLLTKAYTPSNINRSTVVLAQDVVRFSVSCLFLVLDGNSWSRATYQWTLLSAILGAGIPAALYLVQSYCTIMAYQNLPPVSFNVLNQSKTLSAALCCYLVMGKVQSKLQVVSLFLLLTSALVLEKLVPLNPWKKSTKEQDIGKSTPDEENEAGIDTEQSTPGYEAIIDAGESDAKKSTPEDEAGIAAKKHFTMGVVPVLVGSFISGLGK